jgi:ketosteroid isomerase-like protein
MSEENVELARRTFEAFKRTYTEGTDDLYALLDPDIEWIPATAILEGRSYHGHEGVRQWVEDMQRDWEAFEPRPEDFRDLGTSSSPTGTRGRGAGRALAARYRWHSSQLLRTYDRLISTSPTPQPHNPLKRESDMFRVLIMFAAAAAIVIAVALLFGSVAGLIVGVILVAIGLWRTWSLIQDWRRYGSDPAER